jgi:hypothetical protein
LTKRIKVKAKDGGQDKYKFERQNGEKHKERWKKMRLKIK